MAKFILNRPDDYLSLSKKSIIGTTLKWFVILIAGAVLLRIVCIAIYMSMGMNPMELTKFGGDFTNYVGHATWKTLLKLMIVAPLAEEIMFRLGLSFKRQTVALWLGLLPIVCAYYLHKCYVWYILLGLAAVGGLIFWLICRFTTDEQWNVWRKKYIIPAMWISAIGFGLFHFQGFLRPELASVSVCPCDNSGPNGRRLCHHLRKSQPWLLVGCFAALHHQYTQYFDDCLVYGLGCC